MRSEYMSCLHLTYICIRIVLNMSHSLLWICIQLCTVLVTIDTKSMYTTIPKPSAGGSTETIISTEKPKTDPPWRKKKSVTSTTPESMTDKLPMVKIPRTKISTTRGLKTRASTTKVSITKILITEMPTTEGPVTEAQTTKTPTTRKLTTEMPTMEILKEGTLRPMRHKNRRKSRLSQPKMPPSVYMAPTTGMSPSFETQTGIETMTEVEALTESGMETYTEIQPYTDIETHTGTLTVTEMLTVTKTPTEERPTTHVSKPRGSSSKRAPSAKVTSQESSLASEDGATKRRERMKKEEGGTNITERGRKKIFLEDDDTHDDMLEDKMEERDKGCQLDQIRKKWDFFSFDYIPTWISWNEWKNFPWAYSPSRLYDYSMILECSEGAFAKIILWIVYFFITGWYDFWNNILYYYLYFNDKIFDLIDFDPNYASTTMVPVLPGGVGTEGSYGYFSFIG